MPCHHVRHNCDLAYFYALILIYLLIAHVRIVATRHIRLRRVVAWLPSGYALIISWKCRVYEICAFCYHHKIYVGSLFSRRCYGFGSIAFLAMPDAKGSLYIICDRMSLVARNSTWPCSIENNHLLAKNSIIISSLILFFSVYRPTNFCWSNIEATF